MKIDTRAVKAATNAKDHKPLRHLVELSEQVCGGDFSGEELANRSSAPINACVASEKLHSTGKMPATVTEANDDTRSKNDVDANDPTSAHASIDATTLDREKHEQLLTTDEHMLRI